MANKRGRPRKMGLDWFPFDVTLLTDRKLRRPRAEFGSAAVLTYIALLSLIYRDKGYYLAYQGDGREDVALDVADLIGGALAPDALAQADQIQKIIGALVDRGLFDRACFEAGVLTSRRIQRTYYNAVAERTSVQINWDVWILSEEEMSGIQNNNPILNLYRKEKKIYDKPIFSPEKPIFPAEKSNFLARNSYRIGDEKIREESIEEETLSPADAGACRADARREDLTLYRDYWNRHVAEPTGLPKVREVERWSAARIETLDQRIGREGERGVLDVFDRVARSNYLSGKIADWRADFDWVIADGNFQKIAEGRFDNYKAKDGGSFYDKLARGDL